MKVNDLFTWISIQSLFCKCSISPYSDITLIAATLHNLKWCYLCYQNVQIIAKQQHEINHVQFYYKRFCSTFYQISSPISCEPYSRLQTESRGNFLGLHGWLCWLCEGWLDGRLSQLLYWWFSLYHVVQDPVGFSGWWQCRVWYVLGIQQVMELLLDQI